MDIAGQFGASLPVFDSLIEARSALLKRKDDALAMLQSLVALDFTPESLKLFEAWYFDQRDQQDLVSAAVGFYLGEVLVRNAAFSWTVEEFVFRPGHYEIGVTRGLGTIMLTNGRRLTRDGNVRMQSLYREYRKYASV